MIKLRLSNSIKNILEILLANFIFTCILLSMKVFKSNNNFNKVALIQANPTFGVRGKPITLQYVVDKRSYYLPERVLSKAKEILKNPNNEIPTLMELHKSTYAPILNCKTLDEVKKLFPEFKDIKSKVEFLNESVYTKAFKAKTTDSFVLDTLKAYWCKLETFGDIAKSLGMKAHSSIQRALVRANFVSYHKNYRILLNSSDPEGNRIIASKTTAWNKLHPDLMYEHNKKAAQGCKTEKYKAEQSKRIKNFYDANPDRREKVSEALRLCWQNCPEVREAMSKFLKQEDAFVKLAITKKRQGKALSQDERKTAISFYKRFWAAHPELKEVFAEARKGIKVKD